MEGGQYYCIGGLGKCRGKKRVWIQAGSGASQSVPTLEQRRVYSKGEGKKKKEKLAVRETAAASGTFKDKFKDGRFVAPTDQPPC